MTKSIQRREITSVDLLDLYLNRINQYNDEINAVVAMDIDAARARAAEADKALAQGQNWGPLHGVPMTVKDVFEVVGMPATSGDPNLKGHLPKGNAIAVQRLIDAGAIIFGKTNVPYHALDIQSYNQIYGTTNNPWDVTRTPGGSSGGSARPDVGLAEMNFLFGEIFNYLIMGSLPLPEWVADKQKKIEAIWDRFFEHYDVLLAPVAPTVAFSHDHEGTIMTRSLEISGQKKPMLNNMTWTRVAIVSGLPATVTPVGLSVSGLPVGIQIIGARLEDRTTIDFARKLSELIGGFVAPPGFRD